MENEVYTKVEGNHEGVIKEINGRFVVTFTTPTGTITSASYTSLDNAKTQLDYYFDHYETA